MADPVPKASGRKRKFDSATVRKEFKKSAKDCEIYHESESESENEDIHLPSPEYEDYGLPSPPTAEHENDEETEYESHHQSEFDGENADIYVSSPDTFIPFPPSEYGADDIPSPPTPEHEYDEEPEYESHHEGEFDSEDADIYVPSPDTFIPSPASEYGADDVLSPPTPEDEFNDVSEYEDSFVPSPDTCLSPPTPENECDDVPDYVPDDEVDEDLFMPSPEVEANNTFTPLSPEDMSGDENDSENEDIKIENNINNLTVKVDVKSAFKKDTKTYRIYVKSLQNDEIDAETYLNRAQVVIQKILIKALEKIGEHKAVFNLHGTFLENAYEEFNINDSVFVTQENQDTRFELVRDNIVLDFNKDDERPKMISYLDVNIHRGISVTDSYLRLPNYISYRHVVNVNSRDNESFKWAVLAALHPEIYNPGDHTLGNYSGELILNDIEHPVKLRDIPKIEVMNKNMSFNVYVLKYNYLSKLEEIEGPVYHTKNHQESHFNLLLLHDGPKSHYCYIKDLGGLVNANGTGYICDGCLCFLGSEKKLKTHQKSDCMLVKTVLPNEESKKIKFNDKEQGKKMPLVVYADFEAYMEPVEDIPETLQNTTDSKTYSRNVSKHVPFSFAYYIKCSTNDRLSHLETYHGEDCEKEFIKMLKSDLERICKKVDGVETVPIFFHNFSNYDAHFVVRGIDSIPGAVNVLGGKHYFIAIHKTLMLNGNKVELRFLDSIKFVKGSLESLANTLKPEEFIELRKFCRDDDAFNLLSKKGAFPYEYITCLQDLDRKSLPEKRLFYSSVKASHISDEEYERAVNVWDLFKCKDIYDYSQLYLKTDVLLLADVFENLRRLSLKTYNIDPAKFYSMSAVTWEAMLKITEVELELLTDVSMLMFFKKAMRGGIAHCCRRHAVANNKYLPGTYDEDKEDNYLMYYDASNLYGWAMSQSLPYGGFKWVDNDVDYNVPAESEVGFLLEVDLEYPDDEELHDRHADFPFCPEKKVVPTVKEERLITDLTSKKKYVLHHSYLIQCLKHGLVLKKVHRVLQFKQRPWLKPYIDYNTRLRSKAKTDSQKDFYKQMNNSLYGKTIQNIEKYVDVKTFDHWFDQGYKRGGYNITGRPEYHSHDIISDNLIMVQLNKTKFNFKEPVYVGISILDLSKCRMYDFHYGFMQRKYGEKLKLLYTDTDSFIYQIFTKDHYADMKKFLKDRFNTADYPEDNQFGYDRLNKMKVGYFKDEFKGEIAEEYVALRPKVYAMKAGNSFIGKAAGAPKVISEHFTIDDFKQCLFNQEKLFKECHIIKAIGHDVYTQKIRKAVLQPIDPKRHVLENNIDSLPFGHYKLKESN